MKKLSLIIPVYNEEDHLEDFLNKIDTAEFSLPKELVIVDDCSTDGSAAIIKKMDFRSECHYFRQETNQGKGKALQLGFEKATGDIIGVQDADFEYDIEDINPLLTPLLADKADVVYGSRFKPGTTQVHRTFHYLVNRLLTLLSNLMSGLYLSDMETCYKFFRSDVIKNINLESERFGFEPEITAKIARLRLRITEIPISYYPRSYLEGKKITWRDGVAALRHIMYFNLRHPTYKSTIPKQYLPRGRQWL